MKDLGNFFTRRYSAVNSDDEQQQQLAATAAATSSASSSSSASGSCSPAALLQRSTLADKARRKSLKAKRSMDPAGILSSFFNERQSNKRARSPKCAFLLLAIGILAITTAVLVKNFHPYDLIFKWKLIMSDDGEIFNLWAKPPVDLYIKIYLFNITNAEAFLAGREKMRVEQVGPYVYKEIMTHENITFNPNQTMSTEPSHPLVWQEHMSEGRREDDQVVMLNIAMLAISHLMSTKPFFLRMALNTLFVTSNAEPLVRMTAKEFMFGYPSSLTTLGNTFLPNWIYFEKVGLIDRMYDFSTDFETFHTGVSNPSISGLYATYRGERNLPNWHGEHCSNIELASDGTKFKSFLQPNESVKFFRKSMCRPIQLHRIGEAETYGSLTGYKYVFEENAFDNGRNNEANKCYCRNGHCQPDGLIDVTDCYYGFPISLSYPHFMDGDIGLQQNITGMEPQRAKHSSAFVIQPESGLPLSLSVKVQINMHFNDLSPIRKAARFSHLTAPMLWFEIMMPQLPDALDSRFNFYLNILPYLDILGFWLSISLGVALLVYAVTRATIQQQQLHCFRQHAISEGGNGKYGKANLLHNNAAVYNPCEMKLIQSNEKPLPPPLPQRQQQHIITRAEERLTVDENDDDDDAQTSISPVYSEIDRRQSAFALELEPAISGTDSSGDEDNESDTATATLSRNSTASSSCIDDQCEECAAERSSGINCARNEAASSSSNFGGSDFPASIIDLHVSAAAAASDASASTATPARNAASSASSSASTAAASAARAEQLRRIYEV